MAVRVEDECETTSDDYDDSMDGDNASALASAGWGTDEDYGGGGGGGGGRPLITVSPPGLLRRGCALSAGITGYG